VTDLISIVIPTYNSEKTIKRALNSVLNQSYKKWEVIIIDSFSKDKTIKFVKSYRCRKIKILYISKNKGLAKARYQGIKKSNGKVIAFLDSDDDWHKNKLLNHLKFYNLKSAQFSCSAYNLINKKNKKKTIHSSLSKFDFKYLLSNRPIALSTVMIERRLALSKFKKYQRNDYAEDYLWWLVALKYEKYCHILPKNLSNIYLGGQNRSLNFFKNYISLYKIYKHNFKLSNLNIIKIYALLFYRTLGKNIFKFKSFYF